MLLKKNLGMVVLAFCWITIFGQEVIPLSNPSFEGVPRAGTVKGPAPYGWHDCGKPGESAPDIQPGYFQVHKEPQNGASYLGLVIRDNDTWEAVSQNLEQPLQSGKCYTMSMFLARSDQYLSPARTNTNDSIAHVRPAKIRIWGGRSHCSRLELLDETDPIKHTEWKGYSFRFEPQAIYTHLYIEAFFQTPTLFAYNGNVLVDNLSDISLIPCEEPTPEPPVNEPEIAQVDTPGKPINTKPSTKPSKVNSPSGNDEVKEQPRKETIGVTKVEREGQTISIDKLYFPADSFTIVASNYPVLDDIYLYMIANPMVKIEVGGHTNNRCQNDYCNWLSEQRAKAVVDYLVVKGISNGRLSYKGYGSRRPVATNETKAGRKKNQRVEVKITSLSG